MNNNIKNKTMKKKETGRTVQVNHHVNFGKDVNSAHVSIVIYLRLQGTSVQSFISPFSTFCMPC